MRVPSHGVGVASSICPTLAIPSSPDAHTSTEPFPSRFLTECHPIILFRWPSEESKEVQVRTSTLNATPLVRPTARGAPFRARSTRLQPPRLYLQLLLLLYATPDQPTDKSAMVPSTADVTARLANRAFVDGSHADGNARARVTGKSEERRGLNTTSRLRRSPPAHRTFLSKRLARASPASMEDDDDAFLYGDEPAPAPAAASKPHAAPANGATSSADAVANTTESTTTAPTNAGQKDQEDEDDDDDGDDDDADDDDSDSDIEFIIDATQEAQPPARPGARPAVPGARPLPTQSTPQRPQSTLTSEYTPLSRSQLLANASPASAAPAGAPGAPPPPPGAPPVKPQLASDTLGPEGGPPAVPSTAPRLNLSPGPDERAYPKPDDVVEEEESSARDIFDIDLESLADKPWRRYGADLTDYFNYGFNEDSWSVWRAKKEHMTGARKQTQASLFGGAGGEMPNMQQMMAMMPPPPQAMQAMMSQMGASNGGAGPMGMPPMPPDQMMAMMASMSGMPPMPGMPPPMMMPGMFGQPFNGDQTQPRQDGQHSPYPPQDQDQGRDGGARGWDAPASPRRGGEASESNDRRGEDEASDAPLGPLPPSVPMKPMSGADMSAFFGASGVDASQVAAAGIPVPPNGAEASDAGGAPSKKGGANTKPGHSSRAPPPGAAPSAPKGTSIRGRAAAAAAGAGGSSRGGRAHSPLPANVPSGPRNPGKRYNDRDTGAGAGDALDYGATAGEDDRDRRHDDEWDRGRDHGRDASGWDMSPRDDDRRRGGRSGRSRREGTYDSASANGRAEDDGYSRRGGSRSKRDEWDDDTASQTSASGRRRRGGGSRDHRSEPRERERERDRDVHRSDRDRDREREREREREVRSQARSERRAGRDLDDPAIPTGPAAQNARAGRKRSAPEDRDDDEHDAPKSSTRSRGGRKKR
ncbi:uncharacterized protein PAN0_006d3057 [Moesziomyces antarcticus]|uniref:Pre-mRNA polyadenylation factor Fip1 domain-containing protein n=2 Tax=Pseudozyma antarctica TaxID=84753 RepID=A0A081CDU6_PSEA2|nr:uncharacterized protein PAN0_006d3057 [Moesziomyces antarcticus]GAK64842.1 hypothetical protein PAN0_006d3057 [Moesziomyces antarcticus]